MSKELKAHVAAFTHPGLVRSYNEDCVAVGSWIQQGAMTQPEEFTLDLTEPLLCLVADGLGGHAAGEVASRYVAHRLSAAMDRLGDDERAVADCLQQINADMYTAMRADLRQIGMGATVAGLIITAERIIAFNIGDSRIYRRHKRKLLQLSIDDTPEALYPELTTGFRSHVVTQCLGGLETDRGIVPHTITQPVEPGGMYLLCSDGLTDMLTVTDMQISLSKNLAQTVNKLFNGAMSLGGEDNISIIIIKIASV